MRKIIFVAGVSAMVKVINKNTDKEKIREILKEFKGRKQMNAKQYLNSLKLSEDPLTIQKKLRDEWE